MSLADFILPDIGEGIVECELVEWRIQEGDFINEDQPVADVSTDKALVEITAMHTGRVSKLYYQQGETAKVHTPLFAIEIDVANSDSFDGVSDDNNLSAEQAPIASLVTANEQALDKKNVLATPAVRRIARENNLDLSLVPSSGPNGRVLKEDAINYLKSATDASFSTEMVGPSFSQSHIAASDVIPCDVDAIDVAKNYIEPIKGIRAVMAKAMLQSVSTIPHFTYADEVDMTGLIAIRAKLKDSYAKQGVRLTMMPFFIKALSLAIKQFPILNSQVNNDCSELHYLANHNIGMAVDSPTGLLVPNIKNVQDLSIIAIAEESNRLIEQAREGRSSPNDLKGGTITVSNVGAIGGTVATPIISKPEVAIVALGKVQSLPRFDAAGNVCAQQIMTISWSGDHRVIDGATMARFSNTWKAFLEDPSSMLMAMS